MNRLLMIRFRTILKQMPAVVSLLLCVMLVVAWKRSILNPPAAWWNHSAGWPHYHFAMIDNNRMMLAEYREVRISPLQEMIQRQERQLERSQGNCEAYMKTLKEADPRQRDQTQISQARATNQRLQLQLVDDIRLLKLYHEKFDLPPVPGLHAARVDWDDENEPGHLLQKFIPHGSDDRWEFVNFSYTHGSAPWAYWRVLRIPIWAILSLLLIVPVMTAARLLRLQRRRKAGLCLSCGYDMRGSPEQCPECGARRQPNATGVV